MSRKFLRDEQTIKIHKFLIREERCHIVIIPHKQNIGYIKKANKNEDNNHETETNKKNEILQNTKRSFGI